MELDPSAPNGVQRRTAAKPRRAGRRAASEPLGTEPASPAAPELPKNATKADDLEAIKQAVDDAAAVSGALWFSYLFVLFYFAIAAGAVTHADLFLENPVKLPFLGIELPLLAFFLAPILFVVTHAYILVHLVMLTDKAKRFDQALRDPKRDINRLPKSESAAFRDGLQRQLPSNIFIQFLAGPSDLREGAFGWLLRAIAWVTLVVGPVLLLLLMQIQFLPFHNNFITWTNRLALLADLILVWCLWRKIPSGREVEGRNPMAALAAFEIALLLSFAAVFFSWIVTTFPGESQEEFLAKWDKPRWAIAPHNWVFNLPFDSNTGRRKSFFSSTLVLPDLNI